MYSMRLFALLFIFSLTTLFPQGRDTTGIVRKIGVSKDTSMTRVLPDSLASDTTSGKKKIPQDTLKPVNQKAMSGDSYFINRNEILRTNYKTAHDVLGSYPLNFVKDYGFAVHPNDLFINGSGNNTSSYYVDGVVANGDGSWYNPLYIQTENIDSIEIIPAARSFIYGINNSSAGVNFLTRNQLSKIPLTRIRYHEGPMREGTLDAQYSSIVFRKFVLSFDFTSKKVDDVTRNWSSSTWLGNAKLKYFVTDKLDLIGSYDYRNYKLNLTGGIDLAAMDSIGMSTIKDVYSSNSLLYDSKSDNKGSLNGFSIKALSTYIDSCYSDITFYYRSVLDEYRQSLDSSKYPIIQYNKTDVRSKIFGGQFRQLFKYGIFDFDVAGNYQSVKYDTNRVVLKNWENSYSLGGRAQLNIPALGISASGFGKIAKYNGFNLNGAGADATLTINSNTNLYFGFSTFNNVRNNATSDSATAIGFYLGYFPNAVKVSTSIIEGGINYSDNMFVINAKAVYRKEGAQYDYFGAGLNLKFRYWKLLIENNTSFNDKPENDNLNYVNYTGPAYFHTSDILPRFQVSAGFYYKDILFDSNLDLKTGISARFTNLRKETGVYYYGLFKQNIFTVNFELSGEIQKTAILYFAWENLLNNKYFIVPFYLMPQQIIRFGVAWDFRN